MCGINGIIANKIISDLEKRIVCMNTSIKHRGPDDSGVFTANEKIGLGHRRLSIIDLEKRSNQPMHSNTGKTIIVYNGEIFNFIEIKKEIGNAYKFKTKSDTEVILAAYELYGIDWLVSKLNGMFAFCIYDLINNKFYLVRDRFGIKPLFYTIQNECLIFSSEIKGILNAGIFEPEFNEKVIDEYLANRYVREPYTFFKNIYQVKSSTYIEINSKLNLNEKKYWEIPKLNFEKEFDEEEILRKTTKEVEKAIKRWFIADVKVGTYLSGGVDSSLTTAILAKESLEKINTYTIGFREEGFNEFKYADIVAKKYQTKHTVIELNKSDYFDKWIELIKYKDAPLAVPNEIPLALMSTVLKNEITVVISGEGADELFGGYGRIFRSAFDFKNNNIELDFYNYFINKYDYVSRELRDKYLNISFTHREEFDEKIKRDFSKFKNEENIFRFFHNYHIKGLLNRVDMTTMQTSVEARPPFLDHKLIEFVYKEVPYDLKLKWKNEQAKKEAVNLKASEYSEKLDTPKYILKKVAEKYLPDEIIYRKKVGFPVPLQKWFPNLILMSKEKLKNRSWLKSGVLDRLIKDLDKNQMAGQLLWMFINVAHFEDLYFNNNKKWKW